MVADVERAHAGRDRLDKLGVAVAEVERAAVEVHVDQAQARHVPDEVAVPPVDDEVDAGLGPEVGLARVPVLPGLVKDLGLGLHAEDVVVVHRPAFALGRPTGTGGVPGLPPWNSTAKPISDRIMYRSDLIVKSRSKPRPAYCHARFDHVTVGVR